MRQRGFLIIVLALLLLTFLATGLSPTGYVVHDVKDPFARTECAQDLVLINQLIPCEQGVLEWDRSLSLQTFS